VISGDLERATELQQSLIPKDVKINGLDWAVGFKPCRWVGGDYVDVVRAPGGRVLLIIADVSGKGLQAALVSSSLHTMVHTALKAGLDLAQIFHSLNDYLCETLIDSSFVTMAAVLLDPESGKLDCVNAGHLPVLVMSTDGGNKRELQSAVHLPLGVVADMPVEVQSDTLEKGEMLAMYTDGITELYDGTQRNKLLGIDRFSRFLASICESKAEKPVSHAGRQLTDLLDKLQTPLRFADDRTFLLARRH
jgi:serine phosphatase RsbU (regulator of sigma subunit)